MSEQEKYSKEFKAKVVLEAVSGEEVNPLEVAKKYELDPSQLLSWARQMEISDTNIDKLAEAVGEEYGGDAGEVDLDTSDEVFATEVSYGAAFDTLNMKRLWSWVAFGSLFVLLAVLGLMAVYSLSSVQTVQQVSERSEYYEVRDLKLRDQERLSSFGVVDLEEGIYHVPIDSVINRMAEE